MTYEYMKEFKTETAAFMPAYYSHSKDGMKLLLVNTTLNGIRM